MQSQLINVSCDDFSFPTLFQILVFEKIYKIISTEVLNNENASINSGTHAQTYVHTQMYMYIHTHMR